jgi:hypothetical protein
MTSAIMSLTTTRREFGAFVLLTGAAGMRGRAAQYLPRPKFYWGIGIENCWMAQTNPAKDGDRRLLDGQQVEDHPHHGPHSLRHPCMDMADGVMDDRFPDAIGRYAGAMAAHFKGLIDHYSPHNEPQLTCLFCGLTGRWPPYTKSLEGWSQIGVRVAKGMVLEMEAIRAALPDAVILFGGERGNAQSSGLLPGVFGVWKGDCRTSVGGVPEVAGRRTG